MLRIGSQEYQNIVALFSKTHGGCLISCPRGSLILVEFSDIFAPRIRVFSLTAIVGFACRDLNQSQIWLAIRQWLEAPWSPPPGRLSRKAPAKYSIGGYFSTRASGASPVLRRGLMKVRQFRAHAPECPMAACPYPEYFQPERATDRGPGNIASVVVMKSFMTKFGLDTLSAAEYANTKGWVVSIATAGAVFGCLACSWLTQRLGRKWTMQTFTVIYIAGILGQTFCGGHLAGLYVSRLISGFGIGGTTVLPSIYISEVSSRPHRIGCLSILPQAPLSVMAYRATQ